MRDLFEVASLSSAAVEVLGQLFVYGPTWDGDLISKAGRSELLQVGLVFKVEGFTALTADGLRTALDWDLTFDRNDRWYCKQQNIPWPRS